MTIKHKYPLKCLSARAFTLVELLVVIAIIGVIGSLAVVGFSSVQKDVRDKARDSQSTIIANALEKYYDDNNEYPSVALMTSQNADLIKQKLKVSDITVLKFPQASTAVSIATSNPSPTQLAYSANTSDTSKNTQCQTSVNGYCDGFVLQYKKEVDGSAVVLKSLHDTFTPVAGTATCGAGETQSGNTCTRTYAATLQPGSYTCPSGGTLSGTTCTQTYAATYSSGGGYYTCSGGDSLSGSTCTHTYAASSSTQYECGGGTPINGSNYPACRYIYSATATQSYYCPHSASDTYMSQWTCQHPRSGYGTQAGCEGAGYNWQAGSCYEYHSTSQSTIYSCPGGGYVSGTQCIYDYDAAPVTVYSCPSGGSVSGSNCVSTYGATYYSYSGGYYCNGSDTLNTSTNICTKTYTATQGTSYYTCPDGGTPSGSTCTYTYTLP